ncbi:MAG TPA: DUF1206 domain-containing protein [Vicinamibacterales bacterium]|nr:DUF1206 domain-containing protein [Vicinamibacterales bacterium]
MTSRLLRLDFFARLGYSAKGVLYGVVGLLAFQAAIGAGGRITDSDGALRTIVRQPFGHTLLLILAIGLFGYAAWRMVEGIFNSEGRGKELKDLAVRGSYVARGLLHALLGWKVLQLYRGFSSRGNSQESLVAETFTWPLGEWMVILGGLGLFGFAVYQIFRAATTQLGRHFDVEGLRRDIGGWAVGVCRAGLAARGIVFVIVAWYLVQAGITGRASQTADSADAIRIVANWPEPIGSWLLGGVGIGLLAYGAFQALNAKYRAIRT